ncbi:hypothetical protein [Roseivivax sediminis]|uniref:Uncharacterized protein n=1 Tax=Roseivivax sediminis TaxID=936889 RepID=A0A1I1TXX7_9RHOB|nr:hypothetical protein [Roseivivax sediminis]SFD63491.1 hypothetical protein SAMN04515678_10241 [Roseivivax sediminis]
MGGFEIHKAGGPYYPNHPFFKMVLKKVLRVVRLTPLGITPM